MGNTPSWAKDLSDNYELIQENYEDENFGTITMYQSYADKSLIFRKSLPYIQLTADQETNYTKRMRVQNPYLVRVLHLDYRDRSDTGCVQSEQPAQRYGFWEYPGKKTLFSVLQRKQQPWTEPQLWMIIYQIVSAVADLQRMSLFHGDLRPAKIFIKDDKIKLAEHSLVPGARTGYHNALLSEDAFLSPQQMESLQKRLTRSPADNFKSDVYAFGITLLHCASLIDPRSVYDMLAHEILESEIHNLYRVISSRYSPCLLSFIQYCLTPSEVQRPTFVEIHTLVAQFQQSIYDQKPFYANILFCNCQDNQHYAVGSKIVTITKQTSHKMAHIVEQNPAMTRVKSEQSLAPRHPPSERLAQPTQQLRSISPMQQTQPYPTNNYIQPPRYDRSPLRQPGLGFPNSGNRIIPQSPSRIIPSSPPPLRNSSPYMPPLRNYSPIPHQPMSNGSFAMSFSPQRFGVQQAPIRQMSPTTTVPPPMGQSNINDPFDQRIQNAISLSQQIIARHNRHGRNIE